MTRAATWARVGALEAIGDTVDGLFADERAAFAAGLLERLEDAGQLADALDCVGPSTFAELAAYVDRRRARVQP